MLNKLLNRCMPWQQRGKWVRILVDYTNTENPPLVKAPEWLHTSVRNMFISFAPDNLLFLQELRFTVTHVQEPDASYHELTRIAPNYDGTNLSLDPFRGCKGYIDIFLYKPSVIEVVI